MGASGFRANLILLGGGRTGRYFRRHYRMDEAETPDPYVRAIPENILACLHFMLVISRAGAHALWKPRPQLGGLLAEVAALTNLTAADEAALSAYGDSMPAIAREAMLRPARLYNFIALGMAVQESALNESPMLPSLAKLGSLDTARQGAQMIFQVLEANETGELIDFPEDFDPLGPGGIWTDEAQAARAARLAAGEEDDEAEGDDDDEDEDNDDSRPRMVMTPVDELRLNRLQLESLLLRAAPLLRAVADADRAMLTPDAGHAPDPADDPADHARYHATVLQLHIRPGIRALALTSLISGAYWYLDADVPFALAASRLRWLRRRDAVLALQQRFTELKYASKTDLTEAVSMDLSLAELLTIYQAQESLALALINEDILPAIAALPHNQPKATRPQPDETESDTDSDSRGYIHWVQQELAADSMLIDLFFANVPLFAEILSERLQDDEAADFAAARTEIAALAELATSPEAV